MQQTATVKELNGNYAVIEVSRKAMCDGCHKSNCGSSCPMSGLFSSGKTMTAKALNQACAMPGDTVEIETSDREVLTSAVLVFILPILFGGIFYTISSFFDRDVRLCTILAVAGFIIPFPFLRILENKRKNREPQIKITRVISRSTPDN